MSLDADIGTYGFGIDLDKEFSNSLSPEYQSLADKYQPYYDYGPAYTKANEGRLVMAETSNLHKYTIRQKYTDRLSLNYDFVVLPNCPKAEIWEKNSQNYVLHR